LRKGVSDNRIMAAQSLDSLMQHHYITDFERATSRLEYIVYILSTRRKLYLLITYIFLYILYFTLLGPIITISHSPKQLQSSPAKMTESLVL